MRVFLANMIATPTLPDLPDDLDEVIDMFGITWLRNPTGCFIPVDRLRNLTLPAELSWHQLLVDRGPVVEPARPRGIAA